MNVCTFIHELPVDGSSMLLYTNGIISSISVLWLLSYGKLY